MAVALRIADLSPSFSDGPPWVDPASGRAQYWARLRQAALDNPDLPLAFLIATLGQERQTAPATCAEVIPFPLRGA